MDDAKNFFTQKGTVFIKESNLVLGNKKMFCGDIHFFQKVVRVVCNDKEYSIPYENIVLISSNKQPTLERF